MSENCAHNADTVRPKGSLVAPNYGTTSWRWECRTHVYVTTTDPEPAPKYGSGFKQAARCLVCDSDAPAVDAAWWRRLATDEERASAARLLEQRIAGLLGDLAVLAENAQYDGYVRSEELT